MSTQRTQKGTTLSPQAYARARQVFLGEGQKVREPGSEELRRLRGEAIFLMGRAFHLVISASGDLGRFFGRPPGAEEPWEAESRILAEQIALGSAWFSLALTPGLAMPKSMQETIPYLLREHWRLSRVRDGQLVEMEINGHARQRAFHYRRREAGRYRENERLNAGLRELLKTRIREKLHRRDGPEEVAKAIEARSLVAAWLDGLPPAEGEALQRILNDEPTKGDADRQARSRAMRRLRRLVADQDATG